MSRVGCVARETLRWDWWKSHQARRSDFCGCYPKPTAHVGQMSLNRCEQRVFDYLQRHPDERHHWQTKFHRLMKETDDERIATEQVEPELWRYYVERSAVASPFKDAVASEGLCRTSMKNLAELLVRLWTEPRPKKKMNSTD